MRFVCAILLLLLSAAAAAEDYQRGLDSLEASRFDAAAKAFAAAANKGNANAQYQYGLLLRDGRGVQVDLVEAHKWFNLAASRGHKDARTARNALSQKLTPAQIADAQTRAVDWTPQQTEAAKPAAAAEISKPPEGRKTETRDREIAKIPAPPSPPEPTVKAPPETVAKRKVDSPVSKQKLATVKPTDLAGAIRSQDMANLKALLEAQADPNEKGPEGELPLHVAAGTGNADAVQLLLNAGARRGQTDSIGQTPLILASARGNEEAVSMLLRYGADLDAKDRKGRTAFDVARGGGHTGTVKLLERTRQARQKRREKVRTAQSLLNELGYEPGKADGLMGRKTRAAIKSFQKDSGHRQNGKVDDRLIAGLLKKQNQIKEQKRAAESARQKEQERQKAEAEKRKQAAERRKGQRDSQCADWHASRADKDKSLGSEIFSIFKQAVFQWNSICDPAALRSFCTDNANDYVFDHGTNGMIHCGDWAER